MVSVCSTKRPSGPRACRLTGKTGLKLFGSCVLRTRSLFVCAAASIGYPYIARRPCPAHVAGSHAEKSLRIEEAGEVLAVDRDGWV